jgi:hypothetical protein
MKINYPHNTSVPLFLVYGTLYNIDKRFKKLLPSASSWTTLNEIEFLIRNQSNFRIARLKVLWNKHHKEIKKNFISSDDHYHFQHNINAVIRRDHSLPYDLCSENLENHIRIGISEGRNLNMYSRVAEEYMISMLNYKMNLRYIKDTHRNFTIRDDGKMTMCPKGRVTLMSDNSRWSRDNRIEISYGRALRQIFQVDNLFIYDEVIEYLTHYLKSQYSFTGHLKIYEGEDIRKMYHEDNYVRRSGTLHNSCMKYDSTQSFLDPLVEHAKILVAHPFDEHSDSYLQGGVMGRALLWKTKCGQKIMDRIYGNATTQQAFIEWAKENNYIYKSEQNYHYPTRFIVNGELEQLEYSLDIRIHDYKEVPYMDTFKYYNDDTGLHNTHQNNGFCLDTTDGGRPDLNSRWKYDPDGNRIDEEDARWCDYSQEWHHYENVHWSEHEEDYIHEVDAIWSEREQVYAFSDSDDFVYSDLSDDHILSSEAIDIDGLYYHPDESIVLVDDEIISIHETNHTMFRINRFEEREQTYELFTRAERQINAEVSSYHECIFLKLAFHPETLVSYYTRGILNDEEIDEILSNNWFDNHKVWILEQIEEHNTVEDEQTN